MSGWTPGDPLDAGDRGQSVVGRAGGPVAPMDDVDWEIEEYLERFQGSWCVLAVWRSALARGWVWVLHSLMGIGWTDTSILFGLQISVLGDRQVASHGVTVDVLVFEAINLAAYSRSSGSH